MKKSDKYPYRPYSNALTKDDSWIMQNMVVFLDNKGLPWAVTECCQEYTVWVWGEAVTQNGSQSGKHGRNAGKNLHEWQRLRAAACKLGEVQS